MRIEFKSKLRFNSIIILLAMGLGVSIMGQTSKPAYLQGMRTVIAGGTTSESVTPAKIEGLKQLGTRRLRLMNVEPTAPSSVSADGATVQWPVTLTYPLKVCRQNQWIPHIIIGHAIPPPLAATGKAGRKFGPTSWTTYDKFINTFLTYVVVEQGFTETEWEVGNEMNLPSQNWVASEAPSASTDQNGFNAYATLYSHIAKDVDAFRHQHPGATLRIGGPAEAEAGHVLPPADWTTSLVRYAASNHLPLDFVSFHAYGNAATGTVYENVIDGIRKELANTQSTATIAVTEWGPSYEDKGGLNYDPIAGAFALDFAAKMALFGIHDTMFLSLSQLPNVDWPAFYKLDSSPSHIMLAFQAVAGLKGAAAPCVGTAGVSCVAVKDADGSVEVVFWNFNWMTDRFPLVMPAKKPEQHTFTVTQTQGNWAGSYDLTSAKMNSAPWQGGTSTANFAHGNQSTLTFSIVVPYGNYGQLTLKPHGATTH